MDIKEFKYAWRYTSEIYSLFSSKQLLEMTVVDETETAKMWDSVCDNKVLQKSLYIPMIVSHMLPVLIGDCGWGDEAVERITQQKLTNVLENFISEKITLLYDRTAAINIAASLFCEKWSDFCYPSDAVFIVKKDIILLYYEDTIYGYL